MIANNQIAFTVNSSLIFNDITPTGILRFSAVNPTNSFSIIINFKAS